MFRTYAISYLSKILLAYIYYSEVKRGNVAFGVNTTPKPPQRFARSVRFQPVLQTVMNILSTHDTPRAINAILDPRDGDRAELARRHFTAEQLAEGKKRLKMAAFLQFMLPGMPCIYYGDEAGMTGYRDPFNRAYYPWGREDGNLVSFYQSLARVKKSTPALRRGTVLVLEAGGGRLMLLRQYEGKNVAVCCNRSENPWTLPHSGTILLGGGIAEYTGETLTLGQNGFCAMERK